MSLAFQHIPFPEYGEADLIMKGGQRGEPTEGPKFNSHFYDALVETDVAVLSCGHDHANDYCGLLAKPGIEQYRLGPWLCYGGGTGFGGYGGYGGYHRRMRVFEIDTNNASITTWKRVEYCDVNVDKLVLVENGEVVEPK